MTPCYSSRTAEVCESLTGSVDVGQVCEPLVAEVSFTAAEEHLRVFLSGHTLLSVMKRHTTHTRESRTHTRALASEQLYIHDPLL